MTSTEKQLYDNNNNPITDAKVQQYTEGLLTESEWQQVKQDRAKLREQISWYQHPKQ